MILVFLMLFHFHQESAQFNIVLLLLRIIFEHNLKKLLNALEFSIVQCQGYKNYCKVVKGYQNLLSYFELYGRVLFKRSCWGKLFARCFHGSKTFLTPQKSLSPQYPALKMTPLLTSFPLSYPLSYSLKVWNEGIYIYIYIYGCSSISRYIKGSGKLHLQAQPHLQTHIYV